MKKKGREGGIFLMVEAVKKGILLPCVNFEGLEWKEVREEVFKYACYRQRQV